jgi:uncharacterized membrane protein YedE/YeeE
MKLILVALVSGILFGLGLTLSQMTNPFKVVNLLDIAGNWDPSLIFVMAGALAVTTLCFKKILKRPTPLFDKAFYLSNKSAIDFPLLMGSAIFGIGWGISGYQPICCRVGLRVKRGGRDGGLPIFGFFRTPFS